MTVSFPGFRRAGLLLNFPVTLNVTFPILIYLTGKFTPITNFHLVVAVRFMLIFGNAISEFHSHCIRAHYHSRFSVGSDNATARDRSLAVRLEALMALLIIIGIEITNLRC